MAATRLHYDCAEFVLDENGLDVSDGDNYSVARLDREQMIELAQSIVHYVGVEAFLKQQPKGGFDGS